MIEDRRPILIRLAGRLKIASPVIRDRAEIAAYRLRRAGLDLEQVTVRLGWLCRHAGFFGRDGFGAGCESSDDWIENEMIRRAAMIACGRIERIANSLNHSSDVGEVEIVTIMAKVASVIAPSP